MTHAPESPILDGKYIFCVAIFIILCNSKVNFKDGNICRLLQNLATAKKFSFKKKTV